MFETVVSELQVLGMHLADALRIANEIEMQEVTPYGMSKKEWQDSIPAEAKKIALQAWEDEQDLINRQYI